jgi:hypothetical protein
MRSKTEDLNNQISPEKQDLAGKTSPLECMKKHTPNQKTKNEKGKTEHESEGKRHTTSRKQNRTLNVEASSAVVRSVVLIAPPSLVVTL